jgi:hypothetical protein
MAPLDDLARWVTEQSDGLAALQPQFPDPTGEAVSRSLVLLSDVAARTEGLRTALDCSSGPAVDGADALGPVPAACVPAGPAPQVPGGSAMTTAVPDTGTDPQTTAPVVPTVSPAGGTGSGSTGSGSGSGSGSGGVPSVPGGPTVPDVPSLPTPSLPLPSLSLPLPGASAGAPSSGASAAPPVTVCLPPLVTVGDC